MAKFPVWRMSDQSLQLSLPERDGKAEGGRVEYEVDAESWEAANAEFNKREPRKPPQKMVRCGNYRCSRPNCADCYPENWEDPDAFK